MTVFSDIPAAYQAINAYVLAKGSALPAAAQNALTAFYPSPVDRFVAAVEALYAARANLDGDGKALGAALANLCTAMQWQALGQTARGAEIAAALTRAGAAPAGAADPAPLPQYAPR